MSAAVAAILVFRESVGCDGLRNREGGLGSLRLCSGLLHGDLSVEFLLGHLDRETLVPVASATASALVSAILIVVARTVVTTTVLHHSGGFRRL